MARIVGLSAAPVFGCLTAGEALARELAMEDSGLHRASQALHQVLTFVDTESEKTTCSLVIQKAVSISSICHYPSIYLGTPADAGGTPGLWLVCPSSALRNMHNVSGQPIRSPVILRSATRSIHNGSTDSQRLQWLMCRASPE